MDSSIVAALLKMEGYRVFALHLRMGGPGLSEVIKANFEGHCLRRSNEEAVKRVCDKLGIPLYVIDAEELFREQVIDYTIHQALQMNQANPCIACTGKIKLNYLIQQANELNCDLVATGHFAKISIDLSNSSEKVAQVMRASDRQHDQSHLLFEVPNRDLIRMLMPLGSISKKLVRKLAHEFELPVIEEETENSTGGCVSRNAHFQKMLEAMVAPSLRSNGMIQARTGLMLGSHEGLYRHTIGQSLEKEDNTHPEFKGMCVVGRDLATHTLIAGSNSDLFHASFVASRASWVKPMQGMKGFNCSAIVSNRAEEFACRVTLFEAGMLRVELSQPLYAATPGEPVFFYNEDELIGGAYIDSAIDTAAVKSKAQGL
jgi:tRNA-specific 2-thiouridylase